METKRRQTSGPISIGVLARQVVQNLRWETRKPPGTEAPGAGTRLADMLHQEADGTARAGGDVPGARRSQHLPGITPASAGCGEEPACETSRALATKRG